MPGAKVSVIGVDKKESTTQSGRDGTFSIGGLPAGRYVVAVSGQGFAPYRNEEVDITAGKVFSMDITLSITVTENVNITGEAPINTSPESNAGAIVLKKDDLKALPDNPADLEAALQALAGPSAGPSGDNNNRTGTKSPFGGGSAPAAKDDDDEGRYKLEMSVQIRNLLNRTNGGTPVGNLSSPLFGEPVSLASGFGFGGGRQSGGNRRLRFELKFSF